MTNKQHKVRVKLEWSDSNNSTYKLLDDVNESTILGMWSDLVLNDDKSAFFVLADVIDEREDFALCNLPHPYTGKDRIFKIKKRIKFQDGTKIVTTPSSGERSNGAVKIADTIGCNCDKCSASKQELNPTGDSELLTIGYSAGYSNTTGGYWNAIGYSVFTKNCRCHVDGADAVTANSAPDNSEDVDKIGEVATY